MTNDLLAAALARLAVAGAILPLLAAGYNHRMLWELDETGHCKPQLSLRWGAPAKISSRYLMSSNGEGARDFKWSLSSTTNSDLAKLNLIITEEAAAEATPLSLACKLRISVLRSKEEQEGR